MPSRIVSFLPSATEILYELGVGDQIVGVTHECNYPEQAKTKPRVIHSSFDHTTMTSQEIDNKVVDLMHSGKDIYILDVANKVSKEKEGKSFVDLLKKRIISVQSRPKTSKPKVLCVEWLDPLFTAGHWVPELVEMTGGINGISSTGDQSRRMEIDETIKFNPDIIILMPCGFDIKRTILEYKKLANNVSWKSLDAVKNNEVYAVNANEYFSKPGPRTITGLEILAKLIHPKTYADLKIPDDSFQKLAKN